MSTDPGVELLPDAPIAGPKEDLLDRGAIATRLVELACAQPLGLPRAVGLVAGPGTGKTSVLRMAEAAWGERGDAAVVAVDAAEHGAAESLLAALQGALTTFFSEAGVIETTDAARDALTRYGEVVSTVVRLAGVKVDLGGALRRSPADLRAEIAENAQQVGRRLVLAIDHVDRLADRDLVATLEAIRYYAQIPFVTVVLAYDRRGMANRAARGAIDPGTLGRLVQVELALPAIGRVLLARLVAVGLARAAARIGRDIDSALPLFDPEAPDALALDLIETPRDAKRVANALAAALPLWPASDLRERCLDTTLRVLLPILDGPRLTRPAPEQRAARKAELRALVADHAQAAAATAAIDALLA